ncbi:hypothetical protein [Inquilinus sp. OTU3971]|uniref:hypothetical protein n=1 Tax=Inquilinus sp. OTU3971 TaxID=3043855 RepID=UPI00313D132F
MTDATARWIVGSGMSALGLLGLAMASRALDPMIDLFGLGLAGFALIFVSGLVKAHWDEVDRQRFLARLDGADRW